MNERPNLPVPGAIFRDENQRMFVYLGEFKGESMLAPIHRRNRQARAGDVPLTDEVMVRVSAIAPVARTATTGQRLDAARVAACMDALQRLAENASIIGKHAALSSTERSIFAKTGVETLPAGTQAFPKAVCRKPKADAV